MTSRLHEINLMKLEWLFPDKLHNSIAWYGSVVCRSRVTEITFDPTKKSVLLKSSAFHEAAQPDDCLIHMRAMRCMNISWPFAAILITILTHDTHVVSSMQQKYIKYAKHCCTWFRKSVILDHINNNNNDSCCPKSFQYLVYYSNSLIDEFERQ